MELTAHSALGRSIFEIAQGTLETAQCPVQCQFGVLFHFRRLDGHQALCQHVAARGDMLLRRLPGSF